MYRLITICTDDGSIGSYLPCVEFSNFNEASKVLHEALKSNNIRATPVPYCIPGYGYTCSRGPRLLGGVFITKDGGEDELLEEP